MNELYEYLLTIVATLVLPTKCKLHAVSPAVRGEACARDTER
jgi:hypothetical protein